MAVVIRLHHTREEDVEVDQRETARPWWRRQGVLAFTAQQPCDQATIVSVVDSIVEEITIQAASCLMTYYSSNYSKYPSNHMLNIL